MARGVEVPVMEGVTTGDMSVEEAAKGYDEELKSATDDQVIEK